MPSRLFTALILIFWLATTSWLFCRDVLPWLQAGTAPQLFKADYSDEVRHNEIRWLIFRDQGKIGVPFSNKERVGSGLTVIKRNGDRSYTLDTRLDFRELDVGLPELAGMRLGLKLQRISSKYVVGPKGDLRQLGTEVILDLNETWKGIRLAIDGKVRDGMLASRLRVQGLGKPFDQALDPVEVSARDSFVNPMHLLHRVPERLHEGRSWPVPLVDPLGDAAIGFLAKVVPWAKMMGGALSLRIDRLFAQVSSGTFDWQGAHEDWRVHEECWVIDYYRDAGRKGSYARTWVRKSDQWILAQEASFQGSRLLMVRLMNRTAHD